MSRHAASRLLARLASRSQPCQHQQSRSLNIHEYQGAALMSKFGVNVPKGAVVSSANEIAKVLEEQFPNDAEVVVKSQVLAGGRGLGTFKNGLKGGVHIVKRDKVEEIAEGQLPFSQDMLTIVERGMLTIEHRHTRLNEALSEPAAPADEIVRLSKELSKLEDFMTCIASLKSKRKEMEGLKTLIADAAEDEEMKQAAAEELRSVSRLESEDLQRMLSLMLPKDEADSRGCILEVRAGTGGEEASLFALDVFRMYERFAQKKLWSFEVLSITQTESKGCKEASASITGDGVYGKLKFESGVHRVQRVPVTEKSGRVHTSAASVAVLPQADEVDVQMRNEDLRIDTYRAGGAGGQHANTTSSAVRVTHLPTGIVIAIQDERSQHMNRAKALKLLRAKLFERERMQQAMARSNLRLEQIGSGDRSERIRTYNFPQGRVTDHRINVTQHSIDQILQGDGLDGFIDTLSMKQEIAALASLKAAS